MNNEIELPEEQYMILNMMAASLITGEERPEWDDMIDGMIVEMPHNVSQAVLEEQIRETASVFAMDMLILKFIQGLPVVKPAFFPAVHWLGVLALSRLRAWMEAITSSGS